MTYGSGGQVTTAFPGYNSASLGAAAVQRDGKLVVAARIGSGPFQTVIARYRLNGKVDTTFGSSSNGIVVYPFDVNPRAIVIQPDGKIIVGGGGQGNLPLAFTLFRLNSDGSPDNTFGSNGRVTTAFSADSAIHDLVLQPDGKIVAAGEILGSNLFALARYDANGNQDIAFGIGGQVTVSMGGFARANGLVLQPDLKIVAAGELKGNFALVRLNPDGQLDQTFGDGGMVETDFEGLYDEAWDVALQRDGKIVAAGSTNYHPDGLTQIGIARYNDDGSPDLTFGVGGQVTKRVSNQSHANSLVLQFDGKIVVAGESRTGAGGRESDFPLVRFNLDGSPDDTFGNSGIVITDFDADDVVTKLLLQPDGKIVATGYSYNSNSQTETFALARYLSTPTHAPVLQTEVDSNHALALDSVSLMRDPFHVTTDISFSADHHTRVILFVTNLTLASDENFSAVSVEAEPSSGNAVLLPVEFVGEVPGYEWLTEVIVKLPDELARAGNVQVSVSLHGNTSSKGFIIIE